MPVSVDVRERDTSCGRHVSSTHRYADAPTLEGTKSDCVNLLGHSDAYTKAHMLHRDISPDNILIDVVTGQGFLSDWDLSKQREHLGVTASPHARSVSTRQPRLCALLTLS